MDQATRAFLLLPGSAAAAYVVLGFWGCTALVRTLAVVTGEGPGVGQLAEDWDRCWRSRRSSSRSPSPGSRH